jgi:tetratricopeptide (TPR) repeat protein
MLLFILPSILIINVLDYFSYKKTIQFACVIGAIIILTGLGDITYRRNAIISNEFNLCFDNIEKYPKLSRPHCNLGNFYAINWQGTKALQEYETAIALNNFGSIDARAVQDFNIGVYYLNEGKYDLALSYSEKAYKIIQFFSPNIILKAKALMLKNEYHLANSFVESELKKHHDLQLKQIFCLILFKEKKVDEAELRAKQILKDDLSNPFALSVLAEIYRYKGNMESAISLWKIYQNDLPQDSYANFALIELYYQSKKYKLLDQEITRLFYLKSDKQLQSYIKDISKYKNIIIYIPDAEKIKKICKERNIYY